MIALALAALAMSNGECVPASAPAGAAQAPVELAYGADPMHRLDLYGRSGLRDAPVLLFVHGNGWSPGGPSAPNGDKRNVGALPAFAERHGFLLTSVNHRLMPPVDTGQAAEDVAASFAWLTRNVAAHGGDPRRIYLVGYSSGGHLVARLAVEGAAMAQARPTVHPAGVALIDAAALDPAARRSTISDPERLAAFARVFGPSDDRSAPTRLIRPERRHRPMLMLYVDDGGSNRSQAMGFSQRLAAAGADLRAMAAPGDDHGSIFEELGQPCDPEGEALAAFVGAAAVAGRPTNASPGR